MAICECGGFPKVVDGKFVCDKCGKEKPIVERIPSQGKLWEEVQNLRLTATKYHRLYGEKFAIRQVLKGTLSMEHKLAEITLILEDDE